MKRIALFFVVFALCLIFGSCTKDAVKEPVLINFINHTGESINHAVADSTFIGFLDKEAETGFILFEEFRTDSGMPDCLFTGEIDHDALQSISVFYWCGTEKSILKPGKYNIEITISEMSGERYFQLQFK